MSQVEEAHFMSSSADGRSSRSVGPGPRRAPVLPWVILGSRRHRWSAPAAPITHPSYSIISTDPNTLPAPSGRHPSPTRGPVETCAHGERDRGEGEAISEEETIAEAEAWSKARAPDEAAAKTCTTKSTAAKSASEPATAKSAATEATSPKTTSVETTATKTTSITGIRSHHRTNERDGG
jgi:hypothetical protein